MIVNDELESGLGGGVCQVASTLHAAVVYADLEVLERRSHSRPSGYTPLGLDAVVLEDAIDLKFRNTTKATLMIHAYLPTKTTVRVELLGSEPVGKVSHSIATVERHDFVRRVTPRVELADAEPIRRQRGQYGFDVTSIVLLTLSDGSKKRRHYSSKYYPVPEVYWVPPGFDLAGLPALPEGATGTEVTNASADETEGEQAAPSGSGDDAG